MSNDNDDIFSDNYVSERNRKFNDIEEIRSSAIDPEKQQDNWQRNTRKDTKSGPEALVKEKIKNHLIKVYKAKVLRTNAGSIVDQFGNTIWLGETGQSDLQAIIPIEVEGFTFGFFAAFEVKAEGKKPSEKMLTNIESYKNKRIQNQEFYLRNIRKRGGIGCFADCVEDVDKAILDKMLEIQMRLTARDVPKPK